MLKEAKSLFVPNLFDIPEAIIMHEIELKVLSISIKSTSDLLLILSRNSVDCFLMTDNTRELSRRLLMFS